MKRLLALPALQLRPAQSGMDALPASLPELQAFHVVDDAFPGSGAAAVVALRTDDTQAARAQIDLALHSLPRSRRKPFRYVLGRRPRLPHKLPRHIHKALEVQIQFRVAVLQNRTIRHSLVP